MKNLMVLIPIVAIIGIAIVAFKEEKTIYSDIALANVEAIMGLQDDEEEQEECSRWIATANCYQKNEKGGWDWCNLRITAIEKYHRTSVVVICHHDIVTQCYSNCEEK